MFCTNVCHINTHMAQVMLHHSHSMMCDDLSGDDPMMVKNMRNISDGTNKFHSDDTLNVINNGTANSTSNVTTNVMSV